MDSTANIKNYIGRHNLGRGPGTAMHKDPIIVFQSSEHLVKSREGTRGLMARPSVLRLPWIPRRSPKFSYGAFLRLLAFLGVLAFVPPIFFHLRLKRIAHVRVRKCGWLQNPPFVCAHGGDSSRAPPNTIVAFRLAVHSQVECVEVDASRSRDGALVALHDRDLQRMSGDNTLKVGNLNVNEIKRLDIGFGVPTLEDVLKFVSKSVKQVIVDAKIGPPLFEEGLASDLLSIINKTQCRNCVVWAKMDNLVRDLRQQSDDIMAGYIVMKDPITGIQSDLLRMELPDIIGVYHELVNEKLVTKAHRARKKVYAWTVDDEVSMQKMLFNGVDSIITGVPLLLQQVMEDIRSRCMEDGFLHS